MTYKFNKGLIIIVAIGIILRILSIYHFADQDIDNEWGIMVDNLEKYGILSVRSIDGTPVPNIFMPPLYPIFLYLIKIPISDLSTFLNVTFFVQLILATISIVLAHKIFLEIFKENLSYLGTLIFSIFPLNVYAVSQISSITLQMFLINIFLLSYVNLLKNFRTKYSLFFALSSSLLILLRGEFFIFVILSLIYLQIKQRKILKTIITSLVIVLIISPYLYRNYTIFNVITVTKSAGYNLLKGNHPRTAVGGVGMFSNVENVIPETREKLFELYDKGPIQKHDLLKDKILMDQAISFIKDDPKKYLILYFKKFTSFIFVDINSNYPNYYSILHIFPKILIALFTILGISFIVSLRINIANYFIFFYLGNIGLFSFFFILPRYNLFLLTIQIVLSLYAIDILLQKIKKKYEKNFRSFIK